MQSQKLVGILVGGIVVGGAVGFGVGMKTGAKRAGGTSSASGMCSVGGSTSDVLFELEGKSYTRDDLAASAKDTLFQIESQAHDNVSSFIKEQALRVTLAREKDKNVKPDQLPDLADLLSGSKPTEAEMRAFFDANKASLPPGTSFEQVKPQLEKFMVSQKIGKEAREKVAALESSGKLKILVTKPMAPTISMDWSGFPSRGSASSSVTVVDVTDYLCTHCRDAKPELEALAKEFGSKVKFVQVDFALRPTGLSGALARGGFCAKNKATTNSGNIMRKLSKFHSTLLRL